jgi:DNA-binding CsgD family transcriptional regulator
MKAAFISPTLMPVPRSAAQETLGRERLSHAADQDAADGRDVDTIRLTPRQLEVLALLCEGLPNKLICRQLSISAGTVKAHISGILRELGVASRLQAVVTARRAGLVREAGKASPHPLAGVRPAATVHGPAATVTALDFGQRITHRLGLTQTGR